MNTAQPARSLLLRGRARRHQITVLQPIEWIRNRGRHLVPVVVGCTFVIAARRSRTRTRVGPQPKRPCFTRTDYGQTRQVYSRFPGFAAQPTLTAKQYTQRTVSPAAVRS